MKKKKIGLWIAAAVAVLLVAASVLVVVWKGKEKMKSSEITAVYLSTGDIYFGKMDWFPWPRLKNVWYIQRGTTQAQEPQIGLAPFKDVFWSPMDEIYLNPKEIIFWTRVKGGTQLAEALSDPEAFRRAQSSGTDQGFKGPTSQPPAGE